MWTRIVRLVAVAALCAAPAAAAQSSAKPPANDDCLTCHADHVDAKQFGASVHGAMACVDCHADLAKVTEFPHADTVAKVACASCHDDVAAKYRDSVHGRARSKAGLIVAPDCADCHGTHDIRSRKDSGSRVYHARVPSTCGKCHAGIQHEFDRSIHAAKLKAGSTQAPSCVDCHTEHAIQRAETTTSRLDVTAQCGTCHAAVVESFRRTVHGKGTDLRSGAAAMCADCHGAHDVLPAANRDARISKTHLVETCGRCHTGANDRFVEYDPHPNPSDYRRSAVLWWANRFYWILIPGCFGFFGLHSALWFWRGRNAS